MQPSSVKTLMEHIGLQNIANSTVLEVGCGQGYLVSHFLNLNAEHVIGTDIAQEIIDSIPRNALEIYDNQTVELRVEDFLTDTPVDMDVNIITMFIGAPKLVYKLLDMFVENPNVQIIAFMKPNKERKQVDEEIKKICKNNNVSKTSFSIKLSGSGEQRKTIILKKMHILDEADDEESEEEEEEESRRRTMSRQKRTMRVTRKKQRKN